MNKIVFTLIRDNGYYLFLKKNGNHMTTNTIKEQI